MGFLFDEWLMLGSPTSCVGSRTNCISVHGGGVSGRVHKVSGVTKFEHCQTVPMPKILIRLRAEIFGDCVAQRHPDLDL